MNSTIHFFDLDGTLWGIKTKAWIIDKNNPSVPLIILDNGELIDILFGVYKKDEIVVEYNGQKFWISKKILKKINKIRPNLKEDKLGVSFIEKVNPVFYKNLTFYKENIKHLVGVKDIDIGILSARFSEENDQKILALLREELDNIGLEINKFYYVSDHYIPRTNDRVNYKKLNILLEHLTGFKIVSDHFVPIKQNSYQNVYFYDDEFQNINVANQLQDIFEEYLRNTDEEVYDSIMKRIHNNVPTLYTNLVTNNSLNRFKTSKIILKEPKKFPIKIEEKNTLLRFDKFNK